MTRPKHYENRSKSWKHTCLTVILFFYVPFLASASVKIMFIIESLDLMYGLTFNGVSIPSVAQYPPHPV